MRLTSLVLIVLFMGGLGWHRSFAQSDEVEYFEATGHFVTGEFLAYYHSVPNPLELYGNPITEAFVDPTTGKRIQYFEKARFELNPNVSSDQRVQLSDLGRFLYVPGPPILPQNNWLSYWPNIRVACSPIETNSPPGSNP